MGRSFRFSPFHQQQPVTGVRGAPMRYGNNQDAVALSKDKEDKEKSLPSEPGVHYGRAHAETVERYQERAHAHEAEEDQAKRE